VVDNPNKSLFFTAGQSADISIATINADYGTIENQNQNQSFNDYIRGKINIPPHTGSVYKPESRICRLRFPINIKDYQVKVELVDRATGMISQLPVEPEFRDSLIAVDADLRKEDELTVIPFRYRFSVDGADGVRFHVTGAIHVDEDADHPSLSGDHAYGTFTIERTQ